MSRSRIAVLSAVAVLAVTMLAGWMAYANTIFGLGCAQGTAAAAFSQPYRPPSEADVKNRRLVVIAGYLEARDSYRVPRNTIVEVTVPGGWSDVSDSAPDVLAPMDLRRFCDDSSTTTFRAVGPGTAALFAMSNRVGDGVQHSENFAVTVT